MHQQLHAFTCPIMQPTMGFLLIDFADVDDPVCVLRENVNLTDSSNSIKRGKSRKYQDRELCLICIHQYLIVCYKISCTDYKTV